MSGRVEIIGDCTLYLGDCLDLLPAVGEGAEAMLTDPPYGIGDIMVSSGRFAGLCKKMGGDNGWDRQPPPNWVFQNDYPTIAFGGNYLGLPPSRGWLAWVKSNATKSFSTIELAWTNIDMCAKHWIGPVGCPQDEKAGHPTQKPIQLMQWCLGFIPGAKTVLDPFMGSGTTGVACVNLGRAFIGVELDPDYFDIACRRIAEAYKQPRLFEEPRPKPVQAVMI
jgi:DNA modification methylase